MNKETEKKLCEITKRTIEGSINKMKDKNIPKLDDVIFIWNAIDYYYVKCVEPEKEIEVEKPIEKSFYI